MKTLLYILLLHISAISFAQDSRLFENTWYLQNVIIDGQDNFPPSNVEVPYVPLWVTESNFLLETSVCNSGNGTVQFIESNSSFFFTEGMSMTLGNCYLPENAPFERIYFNDFFNSNYLTVDDVFSYGITNNDEDYTLTVTSLSGNQAIYGNQILGDKDFKVSQFAIYPNPAFENITLTSKSSSGAIKILIYDIEGKLTFSQNVTIEKQVSIDVSNLSSGIYFLNIETEDGNVEVKKFIKE